MKINVNELIGKKTLVIGDVGRGKTKLTIKIINDLIKFGFKDEITILDFAPNKIKINAIIAGGKLIDFGFKVNSIKYFTSKFHAPRLTGKRSNIIIELARINRVRCEELFRKYLLDPTSILIINDISIYFQVGDLGLILEALKFAETFIANGYYGEKLEEDLGSGISFNERLMMDKLINLMDNIINLNEIEVNEILS